MAWSNHFWSVPDEVISEADRHQLDSLVAVLNRPKEATAPTTRQRSVRRPLALFPFNPNTLSADSLQLLGFPGWLARRTINYRSKGGQFRIKSDLKRLYDFPDTLYTRLYAYIDLPERRDQPTASTETKYEARPTRDFERSTQPLSEPLTAFDLNTADTTQLQKVRGIGHVLSNRIVRFRTVMGGFVSLDQMNEVWGLSDEARAELLRYARIAPDFRPRPLLINRAPADSLARHPYIHKGLARVIVSYREQHGPYRHVEDLRNIRILKEEEYLKLVPYVSVEE
ncbi:DNA uptake protein ComE [Catalinimonas alkaloidigena]|uniref:DNA uptake protein ComE n=2 Tax=Catalinimonas alkaloidigena TaxID=1075417 RepID=A0A1G9UQG3_9BACT|nr:DNA uptake protein ComE [Catalinimonas alkaloidigena]